MDFFFIFMQPISNLLAEATGKNVNWLSYCIGQEALNYEAHLPGAPRWS